MKVLIALGIAAVVMLAMVFLAIMRMDANEYCSRCKGFRRDGKLYLTYMLRIEKINAED